MDIFSFGPIAAILDAAYCLVVGLAAALQPLAGTAAGLLAIVALTALVRIILLPVGISQVRAEVTRQRLAPRLADLQRRHSTDPERLARETMELYLAESASPFSGMLPLLAQLPVVSLVYAVFTHSAIAGHVNGLLSEHAFGAPLGTSFVGLTGATAAVWPAMLVYLVTLALIAVVMTVSRRALALPGPTGSREPTGIARVLSFLPYMTVVFAAFVPLAAAVYILTSAAWTVAERFALRRLLGSPGNASAGRAEPAEP